MENNDAMMRKIRAGRFRENNGLVINTINLLRQRYCPLKDLVYALDGYDITEGEIVDSVHFLEMAGYVELRTIETKDTVKLADSEFDRLEGLVTEKGIRLLCGGIQDSEVVLRWAR